MKLMSPCRNSTTSLERCLATSVKPSVSSTGSTVSGVGDANSTNSNPIRPIGLSKMSAISIFLGSVDAFQLASVRGRASGIAGGVRVQSRHLFVGELARHLGRRADDQRAIGKNLALGDDRAC